MDQNTGTGQGQYEGTDFVCDNCGCEIMVKHTGDHSKHTSEAYTCRCGTQMRLEHANVRSPA
jgi:predicted RNA-binding Zn-ribbon protein involved in translation (DUF1610 family)